MPLRLVDGDALEHLPPGATFPTLADAYVQTLADVLSQGERVPGVVDPTSIGSGFGELARPTVELLGHSFVVDDPQSCLVYSPSRPISLGYCVGQLLWTLAGSAKVDWISYYNHRAVAFAPDRHDLPGAFGARLRVPHEGGDQINAVLTQLRKDPSSRRAVALISTPSDLLSGNRDIPCAIGLHYFIRNGRLVCLTLMRSQSALMVLPYDAFLFMTLQCWIAAVLGLEVGPYHHYSGSMHIYEDELSLAESVLENGALSLKIRSMPAPESATETLLDQERGLREAVASSAVQSPWLRYSDASTGSFFSDARAVLTAFAAYRLSLPREFDEALAKLPSEPAALMRARPL